MRPINIIILLKFFVYYLVTFSFSAKSIAPPDAAYVTDNTGINRVSLNTDDYTNPILHADYSDPDVVAVNGHYYMTASSFNSAPGLPILHSTDLVNWSLINYALTEQIPVTHYQKVQHGNGVWAPNIRYHNNLFWIFYPDPDFGIYVTTTANPAKKWSKPRLILSGKGLIDPTPLWDDNGKSYLLHAWAKSRAGFNNVLSLREMTSDASSVSSLFTHIIDGKNFPGYRTIEGPKFYKRNGYYYIFAPAGGVDLGWQSVFRSKNIAGPYQAKIVMNQGNSIINGPHQGAWIHTDFDEDWFIHFQSKKAYGRIVHLQPMQWKNDWPIIGKDEDGDEIGEPVLRYKKPVHSDTVTIKSLKASDDFTAEQLALQWQWNANSDVRWYSLTKKLGVLRLYQQKKIAESNDSLWLTPSLLLQKLPTNTFTLTTKLTLPKLPLKGQAGLVLFGENYAWIGITYDKETQTNQLVYAQCINARKGCNEHLKEPQPFSGNNVELRMTMQPTGDAIFSYRTNSTDPFRIIGEHFSATKGRWVGAKVGLFHVASKPNATQFIDVDYFRFTPIEQN
ncbi:glycoside hydrolase family 43 protein [Pseudoalteromonas sp. 1_2015MBL_MicDiv]|uniref:glycoside hydrolase family 43 protein n=1 Tax=Pseudoalteromonas sp. 1_2015MBL_MicDiv TaxID=1720343 RepID=UPI000BBE1150|nr:glycoside hydrolase 43 family protein [Pseudoalteromonas sp. 1_2015MBL_MicDiv]ATG79703.1 glycoside hydrolase [Pseudoalteromonas sp. 1_2015MBL_MicDiv]